MTYTYTFLFVVQLLTGEAYVVEDGLTGEDCIARLIEAHEADPVIAGFRSCEIDMANLPAVQ